MRKFFDLFSWWFLGLFAIPTFLIMGSWNSLPGDAMYPVKIGLEKILLFVAKPSYVAEASLNVKYTERRLSETKVLLANDQSGKGLSYLSQQVVATKELIARAPNPEVKKQLTTQYIQTLKQASADLSEQRSRIASTIPGDSGTKPVAYVPAAITHTTITVPTAAAQNYGTTVQSPVPTIQDDSNQNSSHVEVAPTSAPAFVNPTPAPTQVENTQTVVSQIDETQQEIQNSIDELSQDSSDEGNKSNNGNKFGQDNNGNDTGYGNDHGNGNDRGGNNRDN